MLQITDLTYRIAGRTLLERVDLSLPDGHHAGLIGRNGTDRKSTRLNSSHSGESRMPSSA